MAELKIQVVLDPISVNNIEKTLKGLEQKLPKLDLKIDIKGLDGIEKSVVGLGKEWVKYQATIEKTKQAQLQLEKELEKTKQAHERAIPSIERSKAEYEKTRQQVAKAVQENQKYQASVEKTAQAEERTKQAFEKTRQAEEKTTQEGLKLAQQHEKTARAADTNTKSHNQFVATLTRTFSLTNIATTAFNTAVSKIRSAFSEALTTMKEVDTAVSHYRQVTGASVAEGNQLASQAYEIASKYGQAASSYVEAVANYARAGYAEQSDQLAELSMKTQIAGQTTAEIADQFLLTMDAAYKYEGSVEKLTKVLDGAAKIDSTYATTVEKIAAGLGLVAPLAEQVHVSEAELTAAIGTITAATQRSGAEAARALRSLFLNIIGDTTTEIEEGVTATEESVKSLQDVLNIYAKDAVEAAKATGSVIDPMKAIESLAQAIEDHRLKESDLMQLLSGLGGKLRISQLVALISNWKMYTSMIEDYEGAVGNADEKVATALDSWEYKINVLKNTFAEFIAKSLSSEGIKGFIDGLTNVIKMFGNLGTVIRTIAGIITSVKVGQLLGPAAGGILGTITALTTAIDVYHNKRMMMLQEQADASVESAKRVQQEADDVTTLYARYELAKTAYEDNNGPKEEYVRLTEELTGKLGEEQAAIEGVTGALSEQTLAYLQKVITETKNAITDLETVALEEVNHQIGWTTDTNPFSIAGRYQTNVQSGMKEMDALLAAYRERLKQVDEIRSRIQNGEDNKDNRDYLSSLLEDTKKYGSLLDPIISQQEKLNELRKEYIQIENGVIDGDLAAKAKEIAEAEEEAAKAAEEAANAESTLAGSLDEVKESASSATEAIEKFKDSTKVQLDDNFKGFADIWNSAMEDIEKGFKNSATVQAAAKALFGDEFVEEARKQGISAAELINNDFLKKVYTFDGEFTKGEDSGALLAYELYESYADEAGNIIDKNGEVVASFQLVGDELSMSVTDVDKFADAMGEITGLRMDTSWWAAFLEATTQYGPDSAETVWGMAEAMGVLHGYGNTRFINEDEFREAAKAIGFTDQYVDLLLDSIRDLNEASQEISSEDYDIDYHANTEEAQQKVEELTETAQTYENGSPYTATVTVSDQASNKVWEIKSSLNNLATTYTASVNVARPYAAGTKSAYGGMALVNEEGPELIKDGGLARIAGNGKPTLTWLNKGATVYDANETRKILAGADLSSLYDGIGAYATGITRWTPSGSGSTGSAETGSTGSTASTVSTASHAASSGSGSTGETIAEEAAAAEDYLETLKNIVSLRKSELDVTKANNESVENIAARQQAYTDALRDQVNYMIEQGASWTEINNLKVTLLGSEQALAKLYEEQAEAAQKAEEEAKKEAEEKAKAAREEKRNHLEDLATTVEWRRSELELSEARNESTEAQIKKQQDVIAALKAQKEYLKEIQEGEEDWIELNNLSQQIIEETTKLAELRKAEEEKAKQAAEEAAQKVQEAQQKRLDALSDVVTLRKSELNILDSSDASLTKLVNKQRQIQKALNNQIDYMKKIGADQAEINNLIAEVYDIENSINQLYEQRDADLQKKQEEKEQAILDKQNEQLEALKDIVTLRKSELNILDSSDADIDAIAKKQREIQRALRNQINYMQKIGADQADINNLIAEIYDIDTKINKLYEDRDNELLKEQAALGKEKEDKIKEQLDKLKDIVSLRQSELKLIQSQDGSVKDQILKQRQIQAAMQKQINYMIKIGSEQKEINSMMSQWYAVSEEIAKLESGLVNDLEEAVKNKISEINEQRDAEVQKISDKIEKLKEEREVQNDQAELEERMLAVDEARAKLASAMAERNVRIYNASTGKWESVANASNVRSAREALESAQKNLADYKDQQNFDAMVAALEAQQTQITDKYEKITDKWQAILDELEDPVITIAEALKNISDNATKDMREDINSLNKLLKPLGYSISTAKLYDSGGVLAGMGGIKATAQDEMVLPPDLTQRMLSPLATSSFANRMSELKYLYGMSANGNMAGSTGNTIGAQYNGGQYHFGDIVMSAEQAKQTTVYDLVNMSRGLRAFSSSL